MATAKLMIAMIQFFNVPRCQADGWKQGPRNTNCDTVCSSFGGMTCDATGMQAQSMALTPAEIASCELMGGGACESPGTWQEEVPGFMQMCCPSYHTTQLKGFYCSVDNAAHPSYSSSCTQACGDSARYCWCVGGSQAGVNGDPVTIFGGVERKFFLPIGQLTKLLQTKDLTLYASAFAGEAANEQWVDTVVLDSAAGERIVEVNIRRDIANFKSDKEMPGHLETLEVRAPWWGKELLSFPLNDDELVKWGQFVFKGQPFDHPGPHKISFELYRIEDPGSTIKGAPRQEGIVITCASVKLSITSASALEYYYEDADQDRSWRYAHLDFELFDMKDASSFSGVLPEVWGLVPAESRTGSWTDPPKDANPRDQESISHTRPRHPQGARQDVSGKILADLLFPGSKVASTSIAAAVCSGSQCPPMGTEV